MKIYLPFLEWLGIIRVNLTQKLLDMPPNEGPSDVTGRKFSSQGRDGTQSSRVKSKNKAQRLAEALDRDHSIYVFQAALDGLNISYTTLKYFFDTLNPDATTSSSNAMNSWMLTPEGIAAVAVESVFLIAFSMLANHLKVHDDYQLCWMVPSLAIKKNKLYLQIAENGSLRYTVKDPSGIDRSDVIAPKDLGLDPDEIKKLTLKQLQSHTAKILEITLTRGHTEKPKPKLLNKYLIQVWPYFRDSLKGMKNSYKGMSSVLTIFNLLGELGVHDLNLLIVPLSVALGGVTILNRLWYRRMKNQRKEKQDENVRLQKKILACQTMTEEDAALFREKIQHGHSKNESMKALGSAVLAGLTDGLYLYMGVFTLAALSGPLFFAVCAISAVYVLTSVATRIYEETDYQNKLKASQLQVELILTTQLLKSQLKALNGLLAQPYSQHAEEEALRANIAKNWAQLTQSRQQLASLSVVFNTAALLGGLKSGLTAYGVLASILFAVGTVLVLASVAFPPALLMTVVFLGVACLIGFTIHSLVQNYRHRCEQMELSKSADALLLRTKDSIDSLKETSMDNLERLRQSQTVKLILETVEDKNKKLVIKRSLQYTFEVWLGKCLEICRAFFTGVKQASKSVNFSMGTFYHNALFILIITVVGGLVSALSGGLRALAKGFGHHDDDVADHSALVKAPSQTSLLSSSDSSLVPVSPVPSENDLLVAPITPVSELSADVVQEDADKISSFSIAAVGTSTALNGDQPGALAQLLDQVVQKEAVPSLGSEKQPKISVGPSPNSFFHRPLKFNNQSIARIYPDLESDLKQTTPCIL